MHAGYTLLMLAVDEIDCLRAELAMWHSLPGGDKVVRIRIVGAP
jgi:hypothetical protein